MTDYININKLFNDIADEQGIEPGTPEWEDGGLRGYSGSTGGHPAYGWKHDYKIQEKGESWIRAVIANYAHRRCYYLNAPSRGVGYEDGGRPLDYEPELPGDQLNGNTLYLTSKGIAKVTGPDTIHFHISPLFALIDNPGHYVKAQGKKMPASLVASVLVRMLMKSMAGHVTEANGKHKSYTFGDRGSSIIVGMTTEAAKRGLLDPEDQERLYNYILNTTIPHFESAPGLTLHNYKNNAKPGTDNIQIFNGLYWLLPRFYDAWMVLSEESPIEPRLSAIVKRWSQYMLDLETFHPGNGGNIYSINIPKEVTEGVDGKPVDSWQGVVPAEYANVSTGTDWSIWSLRAVHIAAKVLDSDVMREAGKNAIAKNLSKIHQYDNKMWFYGADLEELW